MNPLFFGSSAHPLYGIFHPPSGTEIKQEAVLLCPPFGQEYMRSHRAFRQLALILSKKGYAVMRFDYRGTGDSSGDIETTNIQEWLEDIKVAAHEIKETAHVKTVHLIGLRLGAILAAAASTEELNIDKLILWDTLSSGLAYDEELQIEMKKDGDDAAFNHIDAEGTLHFNGFPLVKAIRDGLRKLDLQIIHPKVRKVFHIVSKETDSSKALYERWCDNENYEYQLAPSPGNWNYVDDFGGILLPQPVIKAIVNWIEK
ncbi:MAG: pimeloyl-ACP methyl ester carboxylesterase [Paraglaciecola sp.]|jgi:pimeloyl-ACP methyl ester carboxylesterase